MTEVTRCDRCGKDIVIDENQQDNEGNQIDFYGIFRDIKNNELDYCDPCAKTISRELKAILIRRAKA